MSEAIELQAELRKDIGKGASRRQRRLHNLVPAIIYGGDSQPIAIAISHNKLAKAMEHESFYSSILHINVEGKKQTAILKDVQRHPFKPKILHIDLQRVSLEDVIHKTVPLHFVNQDTAPGVKVGGLVTHMLNQLEVTCRAKDLPEYIEVDLGKLELDHTLHLSDVKLPKGVTLKVDLTDPEHNLPVASIYTPRAEAEPEVAETAEESAAPEAEKPESEE